MYVPTPALQWEEVPKDHHTPHGRGQLDALLISNFPERHAVTLIGG